MRELGRYSPPQGSMKGEAEPWVGTPQLISTVTLSCPHLHLLRLVLGFHYGQRGPATPTEDARGYVPRTGQHSPQLPVHTVSQNHPRSHQRAH